jgi:5-deoxy-glucuronate isomerase
MSLLVKASREGQTIARVTPETALWKHVGFAAYRLETGDIVHVHEAQREVCIVVLSGTVSIEAGEHKWEKLGLRDSVFEDTAPYAVYLPPKLAATVRADRNAEIGNAQPVAKARIRDTSAIFFRKPNPPRACW